MTKASFIKRNGGLFPTGRDGEELLREWADGKECMVKVHVPRNIRHHRLLFALLNTIVDSGAWDGTTETLLDWCKIGTGHVRTIVGPDGKTYFVPKSIKFESMAQDKFSRWFDRVIWLICDRLLDGQNWEGLRDEIYTAVDGGLSDQRQAA